ncbi:hypothetical protein [Magnetospirillum sulfuroxidans]|uniref:VCBS repeat-containing protein n=1 Tax=Magnetospirillum sulfuroxidans TaxID=611300 RepID=A0ABS5IFB1_9PROT|nr:hypothetical protein [Magnetospirillum sulfuroxidans]MBR9973106.1 hypothetical protein [Magnetospirillum sulfuroxidans]
MRHAHALFALSLLLSPPAQAQEDLPRPVAQIALLPIGDDGRDDVIALVSAHWSPYFQTAHPQAFGREAIRAGRFDLDGDGQPELLLMLNKTGWEAQYGFPLVIANWTDKGWNAVGWSWGDEDTVFATDEIVDGWRSVDTGTQLLRWDRGLYSRVERK